MNREIHVIKDDTFKVQLSQIDGGEKRIGFSHAAKVPRAYGATIGEIFPRSAARISSDFIRA